MPLRMAAIASAWLAVSASAHAQEELEEPPELDGWRLVTATANNDFYLRRGPVEIIEKLPRAWVLTNLGEPELDTATQRHYRSTLDLEEHDCREKRKRTLQSTAYANQAASGGSIYSYTPSGEWRYAIPNSVGERINAEVCEAFHRQMAARRPKKPAPIEKPASELAPEPAAPVQRL